MIYIQMGLLDKNLRTLATLFPSVGSDGLVARQRDVSDLPVWLRGAAQVFIVRLPRHGNETQEITLVRPRARLTFDQLINVYRQICAKTGPNTLLVADEVSPKFRPLLVKFLIPFVFKDESIFAPELALMFRRMKNFAANESRAGASFSVPVKEELHPLGTKLLAAFLSGQLPRQIKLRELHRTLIGSGAKVSPAKLSAVLNELVNFELAETLGKGPRKAFVFVESKIAWAALPSIRLAPFMRTVHDHFLPEHESDFVLAGESALARYSSLNKPAALTIATTPAVHRQMRSTAVPHDDYSGPGVLIQIWREDPRAFCLGRNLNPIELYFSMREHSDERVQTALQQMLSQYELPLLGE
jgi:hypothetical protein